MKSVYSNFSSEEFDNLLEFLDIEKVDSIEAAKYVFIDLEKYIFKDYPQYSFRQHPFSHRELNSRLDHLINLIGHDEDKNVRLFVNLVDVKSMVPEEIFWWSYYNHKFTESKGKDMDAMDKWHELEESIDLDQLTSFKQLRETNLAFYLDLVRKNLFFSELLFASIDRSLKESYGFGMDIAEEKYIVKTIQENHAASRVRLVEREICNPLLSLLKLKMREVNDLDVHGHVLSTSHNVDRKFIAAYQEIFHYLGIQEVDFEHADFVMLINDLDLLSNLPEMQTQANLFIVDLSARSSPNFAYMLLQNPMFAQVCSYAKQRPDESFHQALDRSLSQGFASFIKKSVFTEQIAINYMDDYFAPLAHSVGKTLQDFAAPINTLVEKLEAHDSNGSQEEAAFVPKGLKPPPPPPGE